MLSFRVRDRLVPVTALPEKSRKGLHGDYGYKRGIRINPDDRPDEQASTLVHELLHAVWDQDGLPEAVTEEQACCFLEGPIMSLFVDNVHLRPILEAALRSHVPLPLDEDASPYPWIGAVTI